MKKDRLALLMPLRGFLIDNADDLKTNVMNVSGFIGDILDSNGISSESMFFNKWDRVAFDFYRSRFQNADNFTAELFRLFYKSDVKNQFRFFHGFPVEIAVFRAWKESPGDAVFFAEYIDKKIMV